MEPRQLEDVFSHTVGFLQEDGYNLVRVSQMVCDLQFGVGEALDV